MAFNPSFILLLQLSQVWPWEYLRLALNLSKAPSFDEHFCILMAAPNTPSLVVSLVQNSYKDSITPIKDVVPLIRKYLKTKM
jgi:hypothetical protein